MTINTQSTLTRVVKFPEDKFGKQEPRLLRIRDNVEAIENLMSNLKIEGETTEDTEGILKYTFKVYCCEGKNFPRLIRELNKGYVFYDAAWTRASKA